MNQTRAKELYGSQIAEYRKVLLESLTEKEVLVLPQKELKNLFEGYIHPENIEVNTKFINLLKTLFLPAAEMRLSRRKKEKYIILSKKNEVDIEQCLSLDKPISYGKSKISCIICGKQFDYFRAQEGDCETRYRLRGELDENYQVKEVEERDEERPALPDSLVLCPSCLRKSIVQIGNKIYCRAGKIPEEAIRKRKEPVRIKEASEKDSKDTVEFLEKTGASQ